MARRMGVGAGRVVPLPRPPARAPTTRSNCSWEVFRDLFIQDARPQDARSVWERLVPQPFQPWDAKLDLAEFYRAGLPKSYIAVADDLALPEGTWHPGMSSRLGS